MSQMYTFVALGALIAALVLLLMYYQAEVRDTAQEGARQPLPGKFFIVILITCTFTGMAITESQGVCRLSPWGFVAGIILGAATEIVMYRHSKEKGGAGPV